MPFWPSLDVDFLLQAMTGDGFGLVCSGKGLAGKGSVGGLQTGEKVD